MPVKNIKRRTNDGLEGTITGLTEEEKEVLNKYGFASSKDVEELTKVMPTDVAIKDNKLGLEHDSTWLTNQNAINLGSNMTYDATTKTLNAKGGDELTGAAIMEVSKDSDTITRTLDTDGKVKFDAKGEKTVCTCENADKSFNLVAKEYTLTSGITYGPSIYEHYTYDKPVVYIPSFIRMNNVESPQLSYSIEPEGETGPRFQLSFGSSNRNSNAAISTYCVCTRAGTLTTTHKIEYVITYTRIAFNQ